MHMPTKLKSSYGITAPTFHFGTIMEKIEAPGKQVLVLGVSIKTISITPVIASVKTMAFYP